MSGALAATIPHPAAASRSARWCVLALWVSAAAFVLLAAIGGARFYSTVPFLDMWPGGVQFQLQVLDGQWSAWWAMHHEHRIVLTRVLFWLDFTFFEGRMWFLVLANYVIVAGAWWTWRAILLAHPMQPPAGVRRLVLPLAAACLFSWAQRDNLVWTFQSQFFLAQWLPLLALFAAYRGVVQPARGTFFLALAAFLGVICLGTMANGVLALPVVAAYALLAGLGWRRAVLLALLAAACTVAYFWGFRPVSWHGGEFGEAARHAPLRLAAFVLAFLGSPFYAFSGYGSLALAQGFGSLLLALVAGRAWSVLRRPEDTNKAFELFLLAYCAYAIGTAIGIGIGRLGLGVQQAVHGRYTTPAIMVWLAVLLLYLQPLADTFARRPLRVALPLTVLLAAMWPLQWTALASIRTTLFEWQVTALALELGVRDRKQVSYVHPDLDTVLPIAREASRRELSVFGRGPIQDAGALLGRRAAEFAPYDCIAGDLQLTPIADEPRFLRATGAIELATRRTHRALAIVDGSGTIVGYALSGEPPGDAESSASRRFKGYLQAGAAREGPLRVQAMSDATCRKPGWPGIGG